MPKTRTVTDQGKADLQQRLMELCSATECQPQSSSVSVYSPAAQHSSFDSDLIPEVLDQFCYFFTVKDIFINTGCTHQQARSILRVINDVFHDIEESEMQDN